MLIKKFLENYYNKLVKDEINKVVVAPVSMTVENSKDEDGWVEWKPSDATLNKDDISKIETNYNIKIPEQYSQYILTKQFMDIQIGAYTLFGINEKNTLEEIIDLFPKNIISFGFLPIGQINDEDFIALNYKTGELVRLAYDDYAQKEVIFSEFNEFIKFLNNKIEE